MEDEPRYNSEHLLDNLGVPDDAGKYATERIVKDAGVIGQLRAERDELKERTCAVLMQIIARPDIARLCGPAEDAVFEKARQFLNKPN
ncbi:hypothetical protein [Flexibacterium corallicola]|uniref:hypothetical protein n=1 Tax=Flexibacterium corallicola TaxID=3037259 RepID=UPI00286F930C|nr:hypothetical protein [Pseudovibrio sp. M1P-2-3]